MSRADFELIVAPNPGPMTLEGTNTYVVGRDPAVVIDPGPADRGHIDAVRREAEARGGLGEVLLTHSHGDHSEGVPMLGAEVVAVADGESVRGIVSIATPGHAPDHVCFLAGPRHPAAGEAESGVLFSGDLILGRGSSFVPPDGGSLAAYMASLRRIAELELELLCPGHGPPVTDPGAKIAEYIAHRESREQRLLEALRRGETSRRALLDQVWDDVPAELRPAAAVTMEAHLDKLRTEGRLPVVLSE